MVKRLYLDGCSLTYGHGLPRDESLGRLFEVKGFYDVKDMSRPGKSNLLMAIDTYKNFQDYDTFVIGFTYSARFGIKYQGQDLDFYSGFHGQGIEIDQTNINAQSISDAYLEVYKYFFTIFEPPYCDDLSDMLIDGLITFLKSQNKKVIAYSWEQRNTKTGLAYPYIAPKFRLPSGHLNRHGMQYLYDFLQNLINE